MKKDLIAQLHTAFEGIVHAHPETGVEFWFARDLQPILGYAKWENFTKVIEKAKAACANTGHAVSDHFLDVRKMVSLGSGAQQMKERLGVRGNRPLADFLPTITIKAKDFANEITNFNIAKDGLRAEPEIAKEHVKNNSDVRSLLAKRGIVPEQLPAAEDIKKLERRLGSDAKKISKSVEPLDHLPPGMDDA